MSRLAELSTEEVHVWVLSLDVPPHEVERLARTLSPSQRRRADALESPLQRRRFLCRHGLGRSILAAYLGCRPDDVRLRPGRRGKPEIVGNQLQFNSSSSGDVAVVALASTRRVGVDVERLRTVMNPLAIARSNFTGAEHDRLCAVPSPERDAAFLSCWTRKEAYVKARGDGLGRALDSFTVTVARSAAPTGTDIVGDGPTDVWTLKAFRPGPGHVGAVAAEGQGWRVRCRWW